MRPVVVDPDPVEQAGVCAPRSELGELPLEDVVCLRDRGDELLLNVVRSLAAAAPYRVRGFLSPAHRGDVLERPLACDPGTLRASSRPRGGVLARPASRAGKSGRLPSLLSKLAPLRRVMRGDLREARPLGSRLPLMNAQGRIEAEARGRTGAGIVAVLGSGLSGALATLVAFAGLATSSSRAEAQQHPGVSDGGIPPYIVAAGQGLVTPPDMEDVEHMCALLTSCPNLPLSSDMLPSSVPGCVQSSMKELTSPEAVKFSLLIRECGLRSNSCAELRQCALRGATTDMCKDRGKSRRRRHLRSRRTRHQLFSREGRRGARLSTRGRAVRRPRRAGGVRARSLHRRQQGGGAPRVLRQRDARPSVRPREARELRLQRARAQVHRRRRESGLLDADAGLLGDVEALRRKCVRRLHARARSESRLWSRRAHLQPHAGIDPSRRVRRARFHGRQVRSQGRREV